ncbi:dentin sialophosphoprotein-like [Micropterus salmoides]|uniref:dentin sialophosphoprotein-like n=1 Tax=Micropterus salmoides TaxID=27706 RepID=UPI0018ED26A7|nr:dentin sialophosphoprotein-like [Micropterus salmoides]
MKVLSTACVPGPQCMTVFLPQVRLSAAQIMSLDRVLIRELSNLTKQTGTHQQGEVQSEDGKRQKTNSLEKSREDEAARQVSEAAEESEDSTSSTAGTSDQSDDSSSGTAETSDQSDDSSSGTAETSDQSDDSSSGTAETSDHSDDISPGTAETSEPPPARVPGSTSYSMDTAEPVTSFVGSPQPPPLQPQPPIPSEVSEMEHTWEALEEPEDSSSRTLRPQTANTE